MNLHLGLAMVTFIIKSMENVIFDISKYRDGKKFFITNVGLIATKKSILGDNEVSGRNGERARRRGVLGNGQGGDDGTFA